MQHLAGKEVDEEGFHLRDNGGVVAQAGYDLTTVFRNIPFDTLSLAAGGVLSYDRQRGLDDKIKFRDGFLLNAEVNVKGYGLSARQYLGGGQTHVIGDGLYKAKRYTRMDFYFTPIQASRVQAKFSFVVHVLPEVVDFSQMFYLVFDVGGGFKNRN